MLNAFFILEFLNALFGRVLITFMAFISNEIATEELSVAVQASGATAHSLF